MSPTLLYVTGGAAFGGVKSSWTDNDRAAQQCSRLAIDKVKVGWVAGGGIEHAFAGNWLVRVEGLYHDLGKVSAGPAGIGTTYSTTFRHRSRRCAAASRCAGNQQRSRWRVHRARARFPEPYSSCSRWLIGRSRGHASIVGDEGEGTDAALVEHGGDQRIAVPRQRIEIEPVGMQVGRAGAGRRMAVHDVEPVVVFIRQERLADPQQHILPLLRQSNARHDRRHGRRTAARRCRRPANSRTTRDARAAGPPRG